MSKFGNYNPSTQSNSRFSYNIFQNQNLHLQKPNHWDAVRNNVDLIIKQSKVLKEELAEESDSQCNTIETIYNCEDEPQDVKENPIAEELPLVKESPLVKEEEIPPTKKRMDFASVVFKYRNELARRKHKELVE